MLLSVLKKIKDALTSPLHIGALEVSSTAVKYLLIRGSSIVQASLRLPPGVIEKGVIKNRATLLAALKDLHLQIAPAQRPINVILTIPSNLVFAQSFTVPLVARENLNEAIKLNLQMVSPIKIEESYYDYQEIKVNQDIGQIDLLGAFASIPPIDAYETVLREANFMPVAVEFPGLSLARLIRDRWGGIEAQQQYLIVYISSEGVLMMILKNGNLSFNHFTAWDETTAQSGTLTFPQVKEIIKREMQRVINYYLSRTGRPLEEAVLISPIFNYEIVKLASEELRIKIRNLTITELPKLQPNWFPALGAALRGLLSRSKDTDISLAATGSQTEYYHERTLEFIGLWRNILVGALVVFLAAFVTMDTLFYREEMQLKHRLEETFDGETLKGSTIVREKIQAFNALLTEIEETAKKENRWSPTLQEVQKIAGKDIAIDRLYAAKNDLRGILNGRGLSDDAILAFKDRLSKNPRIESVNLPLSNIKPSQDKTASFSMTLVFKSLTQ
jgi:hypothetical protein